MNANVHTGVGIASATGVALLVPAMQCDTAINYSLYLGCAVIGALLPDIDANGESKAKKSFKNMMSCLIVFSCFTVIYGLHSGILDSMLSDLFSSTHGVGALLFIVMCVIGYKTPHRTFTHWLIGLICFTFSFMLMTDLKMTLWFGVGMLSHQLIDMLNKRKIQWLYPLPFDFAMYVCKASSKLSNAIGTVSYCLTFVFLSLLIR